MTNTEPIFNRKTASRYRAHLLMPDIGGKGQQKLSKAKIVVIGTGGIGAPLLLYLTAAGVAHITIIDHDYVEIENLQRQIIFQENNIGKPKAIIAKQNLEKLNHQTQIIAIKQKVTKHNAMKFLQDFDVIIDCSDNYQTRLVISDTAFFLRTPLVMGSASGYDGIIASFIPYKIDKNTKLAYPSFRCLYGRNQLPIAQDCSDIGVLSTTTAIAASLQANVVLQYLLFEHLHYDNSLLLFDAKNMRFEKFLRNFDANNALTGNGNIVNIKVANIGKLPSS